MSAISPIPAWCDNEAVVSLHQFRSARRGELGDGSTARRRIQGSVAAAAGRPAAQSQTDCGIAAAPRDLVPIDTTAVIVPASALSVVAQADSVALVDSHYALLSQQSD